MARVIVATTFPTPLSDAERAALSEKAMRCIEERHCKWIRSYLSSDRKRRICEFEAPDAESMREAYRSAGIDLSTTEIWTAGTVVKIEDYPEFLKRRDEVRARLAGK